MSKILIRLSRGRVFIWVSEDLVEWHDAELFDAVRELDELIVSMETGKPIQLYPLTIRSLMRQRR